MKNIIVIASEEGASGIDYIGDLGTERSAKALAADVNIVCEEIKKHGFQPYVYNPNASGYYVMSRYFERFLTDKTLVINANEIVARLEDCAGVACVGIPAKSGTANAFACGTHNPVAWHDYYLNDIPCGQVGMYATYFGRYDIPVLFVCGDKAVAIEAEEETLHITTVCIKEAKYRNRAKCFPIEQTRSEIANKMQLALSEMIAKPKKVDLPLRIKISFNRTDFCEDCERTNVFTLKKIDARTVEKQIDDIKKITDLVF